MNYFALRTAIDYAESAGKFAESRNDLVCATATEVLATFGVLLDNKDISFRDKEIIAETMRNAVDAIVEEMFR